MFRNIFFLFNIFVGMDLMFKWKKLSIYSLIYSKNTMLGFIIGVLKKDPLMPLNIAFKNLSIIHRKRQLCIYKWLNSSLTNQIILVFPFQEHYLNHNKRRVVT